MAKTEKNTEATGPIGKLDISNMDHVKLMAEDLKKFIRAEKLFQNIQGKEYVNVEAWQYAGARFGLASRCVDIWDISNENEMKYKAHIQIWDIDRDRVIGEGFGICSNKENGKKYYQEFAIASMAQTRGVGKGYRLFLAHLIRLAGFEPTPAEEMDFSGNEPQAKGTAETAARKPATPKPEPAVKPEQPAAKELKVDTNAAVANPEENVKYASAKQKEEIIGLLNNPVITRQEKTKMLLAINRLDEERAAQAIEKLKKTVEEREGAPAE